MKNGAVNKKQSKNINAESVMGYRNDSPFRYNPYNIIQSNIISMDNVDTPLYAINNGQIHFLPPNSGTYKFKGKRTLELPAYFSGGISDPYKLLYEQNRKERMELMQQDMEQRQREQQRKSQIINSPPPIISSNPQITANPLPTNWVNTQVEAWQNRNTSNSIGGDLKSMGTDLLNIIAPTQQMLLGLSRRYEENRKKANLPDDFNPTFQYVENDYGEPQDFYKKGGIKKFQDGGEDFDAYDFIYGDEQDEITQKIEENNTQLTEQLAEKDAKIEEANRKLADLEQDNLAMAEAMYESPNYSRRQMILNDGQSYSDNSYSEVQGAAINADARKVVGYLQEQHGLPKHVAAGIASNIHHESSFKPTAVGDRGTSYGVMQWRDPSPGKGRKTNMLNWMKENGRNPNDIYAQIDFGIYEAKQRGDLQRAMNTQSAEDAAYVWAKYFERPKVIDPKRMATARNYMKQYQKGGEYDLSPQEIIRLIAQGYKIKI